MTIAHVDQAIAALLKEGPIRATNASLAKPVEGRWKARKFVTYTATVYSVA